MNDPNTEKIKQVLLEKIKVSQAKRANIKAVKTARISVDKWAQFEADELVLRMDANILARENDRIYHYITYPMTWWDHLKERWFPDWLIDRFPPEYNIIEIDEPRFLTCCPHLQIDEDRKHFEYLTFTPEELKEAGLLDENR